MTAPWQLECSSLVLVVVLVLVLVLVLVPVLVLALVLMLVLVSVLVLVLATQQQQHQGWSWRSCTGGWVRWKACCRGCCWSSCRRCQAASPPFRCGTGEGTGGEGMVRGCVCEVCLMRLAGRETALRVFNQQQLVWALSQ
jgi:hypothetical protein